MRAGSFSRQRMRLSVVFELLLVFLFLAFAAARVIEKKNGVPQKLRQSIPNRYCSCTTNMCNCCRDFSLPVVPIKGPGCASIMYLKGDKMMITISFGERVLSNTTISGPKPKPVCMTLPGGITQFCGRVYGMTRTDKNFKACLGLELRALDDVEAAIRVGCFKFSPKGVNLESAPPVPPPDETKEPEDEDDEDDDDDDYGLGDDEDDDFIGLGGDLDDDDDDDDDDDEDETNVGGNNNEVESVDYTGFSVLGEDFFGGLFNDEEKPKKKKTSVKKTVTKKLSTTTRKPLLANRPTIRPNKITRRPVNRIKIRPVINKLGSTSTITPESASDEKLVLSTPKPSPMTFTTERTTIAQKIVTTETIKDTTIAEKSHPTEEHKTESTNVAKITVQPYDVRLPDMDVEKIEAIAAIAQQGVTSSVLHSSSLTDATMGYTDEVVTEGIRTEKYESSAEMTKSGSQQADTDDEEEEEEEEEDLLDGLIDDDDDDEEESEEDTNKNTEEEDLEVTSDITEPSKTEKFDGYEVTEKPKPTKQDEDEDDEEEDSDLLDGIIGSDDDEEDEEENNENKVDKDEEDGKEEEEEEEEEDIIGAFIGDPAESEKEESTEADQSDNKDEEESEEEEDFFGVLDESEGSDDEDENTAAEEVDDEEPAELKNAVVITKNPDDDSSSSSEEDKTSSITTPKVFVAIVHNDETQERNNSEVRKFDKVSAVPDSELLAKIRAATRMKAPHSLKLSDLIAPRREVVQEKNEVHPSSSRTHRRMNLDRWAPL